MTSIACTCSAVLGADPKCAVHGPRTIYVAAASGEIERAQRVMARVVELGGRVALDWTEEVAAWTSEALRLKDGERAERITACLTSAESADRLLLLVPDGGVQTKGAWAEVTAAYRAGVPVIVSCARARLPFVVSWAHRAHVRDDEQAVRVAVTGAPPALGDFERERRHRYAAAKRNGFARGR